MAETTSPPRHWNLHRLRLFWTVASHLSYTQAALQLGIAQPAISHQVRALERDLGVTLFRRRGRRIELTDAGHALAATCADVFARLDAAERELGELETGALGHVDVAADTTSGIYVVPRALGAFHRAYPSVNLTLHVENRSGVLRRLRERSCDLAVMATPPAEPSVDVLPFLLDALVVVAPPDHPLALESDIPLPRLAEERLLLREQGSGTRAVTEKMFARARMPLHVAMELGSTGAIKQAVAAGFGLAVVSRWAIDLELGAGRLVVLDVAGFPIERRWSLVSDASRRLSPAAVVCRDHLAAQAATAFARGPEAAASAARSG
jgi:DNA-binding transcriptional LysR family regulator